MKNFVSRVFIDEGGSSTGHVVVDNGGPLLLLATLSAIIVPQGPRERSAAVVLL